MRLDGKVILITDAGSASGLALAKKLATEGAVLVLNMFGQVSDESVAGLRVCVDPTDKEAVDGLATQILDKFGKIDVLVHNHNEVVQCSIEHCTDAMYDRAMAINVDSAFLFTQAMGRRMKEAGSGRIIFISSIHDEKPTGSAFTYSVAKGALKMLAKETALDLGMYNVTCNVIEAGALVGDDLKFASEQSFIYENLDYKMPGKKLGTHDDIADVAVFLASDESRFINGADLRADGGFTLYYLPRMNYEEYAAHMEAKR